MTSTVVPQQAMPVPEKEIETTRERSILPQILNFLREPQNRKYLRGVMGAGNSNFGAQYNIAARKIAAKLDVPLLYTFEIMGTKEDVARVNEGLDEFWTHLSLNPQ